MNRESIRFLSLQNVIHIHEDTLAHEGGMPGLRDEGLLASAVEMPQAAFAGEFLHESLAAMAAAYLYHLCQNHPFADGNKRTAAFSTVVFLASNGFPDEILPHEDEMEEVTWRVARSEMSKQELTDWLNCRIAE
jgi:death-on-curing protein